MKRLMRDAVISVVDGRELVGVYFLGESDKILFETSPEKAEAIVELWNDIWDTVEGDDK